jgi:hypothetical protein
MQYAQFVRGMIQSVLPLRKDQDVNNVPGRLHIPVVVNMFSKDSFPHPSAAPWEMLLSVARPLSNLKNRLQYTWLHLTQNFQDVATVLETLDKNLLLSQSVQCTGYYADRTHAPLVMNVLTLEIEKRRS